MALERVVKGRVQLSGFVALMFLYCLPFAWGFVNFEFGLGVALWGIAAMLAVQDRPWPVRLLVYENDKGEVWTAYTDFDWIARRHGIENRIDQFKMASSVISSITSSVKVARQ